MISAIADTKNEMQVENKRRPSGVELDADIWSKLGDDLVRKIISRLPFRNLYQVAPSLCKTWKLRFSSTSFKREIESAATSWKSYAPLLVNRNRYGDRSVALVGFESSSQSWYRLPTHPCLPHDLECHWDMSAGAGPLFCWLGVDVVRWPGGGAAPVLVTNPLTGSWRRLPPRPDISKDHPIAELDVLVRLVLEENEAYKVILGSTNIENSTLRLFIQIFDSTSGSWDMESYFAEVTTDIATCFGSVVRNGVLHILLELDDQVILHGVHYKLILMDMKERTFTETSVLYQLLGPDEDTHFLGTRHPVRFADLLVCGSDLMVVLENFYFSTADWSSSQKALATFYVFRLDVESGLATEVSRVRNEELRADLPSAASHGNSIYIGSSCFPWGSGICYDMVAGEWHGYDAMPSALRRANGMISHEWTWQSITYQPGSNPFLEA